MTTATAQSKMTLPAAGEVKAAVQGQRALAAYLATQFETQHIQIFDLAIFIVDPGWHPIFPDSRDAIPQELLILISVLVQKLCDI